MKLPVSAFNHDKVTKNICFFEIHVLKIYPLLKDDFSLLSKLDPELTGWLMFFAFGQRKDKKMSAILNEITSQFPMVYKASE